MYVVAPPVDDASKFYAIKSGPVDAFPLSQDCMNYYTGYLFITLSLPALFPSLFLLLPILLLGLLLHLPLLLLPSILATALLRYLPPPPPPFLSYFSFPFFSCLKTLLSQPHVLYMVKTFSLSLSLSLISLAHGIDTRLTYVQS